MVLFVVGLVVVVVLSLWGAWALSRPRFTDAAEPVPWDSRQAEDERHTGRLLVLLVMALVTTVGCGGDGGDSGVKLDKSEPWDLVWFSDSMGWGVARAWAELIEDVEGVEVRVHDHAIGDASIDRFRQMVNDQESIRQEVADAEIIVVFGNAAMTGPPDTEVCHRTPFYIEALLIDNGSTEFYTSDDFAAYGDVFRDTFEVIFELRAGQPTVIRVFDKFAGMLVDWRETGIEAECTATYEAEAGAIREAADEYGVAMASVYDAFNGPDHDENPREKGYVAGDGLHTSPEGASAHAELLHDLGYGAVIP